MGSAGQRRAVGLGTAAQGAAHGPRVAATFIREETSTGDHRGRSTQRLAQPKVAFGVTPVEKEKIQGDDARLLLRDSLHKRRQGAPRKRIAPDRVDRGVIDRDDHDVSRWTLCPRQHEAEIEADFLEAIEGAGHALDMQAGEKEGPEKRQTDGGERQRGCRKRPVHRVIDRSGPARPGHAAQAIA